MIIPDSAELRFKRRWSDYCEVLNDGTPKVVGKLDPALPDLREEVIALVSGHSPADWDAANSKLDEVWAADAGSWPLRLLPFLEGLPQRSQNAFARLVKAGCQPDMLAFQFCEATKEDAYLKDRNRIRSEIEGTRQAHRKGFDRPLSACPSQATIR